MKAFANYSLITGTITLFSGIVALLCMVTGAYAVEFHFEAFSDPIRGRFERLKNVIDQKYVNSDYKKPTNLVI